MDLEGSGRVVVDLPLLPPTHPLYPSKKPEFVGISWVVLMAAGGPDPLTHHLLTPLPANTVGTTTIAVVSDYCQLHIASLITI